jgi:hydrogenase nickel incorporation protein HypA/HybF
MKRWRVTMKERSMHELSVAHALLRQVEQIVHDHDGKKVVAVTVTIGPLSGVEASLLARAFAIARCGTIAENASLEIETAPIRVWCAACEAETEAGPSTLLCAQCGSGTVELKSGDELLIRRVELLTAEQPIAAE